MYTAIYSIKDDKKNECKRIHFIIYRNTLPTYQTKTQTTIDNRDFIETNENIAHYIANRANIDLDPSFRLSHIMLIRVKEI